LPEISLNLSEVKIIDLDACGHCVPQIKESARILQGGLLLVTSGEIYMISRFKQRDFIKERYGVDFDGGYEYFPREILFEFIKREFLKFGKNVELLDVFVTPIICRLCVKVN